MSKPVRITSYRLAFWHAPSRARHEDLDVMTCIFCQYSEGVARIQDVVAHLRNQGFSIATHDARSFTLGTDLTESKTSNRQSSNTAALAEYVSGRAPLISV